MKRNIRSKITWLLLLMLSGSVQMTTQAGETIRMQLLMDDVHPIYLTLHQEDEQVRGKYIFLTSGAEFRLEGISEGLKWTLREIDGQDQHSGWIIGRWENGCFVGNWYNRQRTMRRDIKGCDDRVLHAEDNKSFRLLHGADGNESFELGLYRLAGDQFVAKWWSAEQQVWATYRGYCPSFSCDVILLKRRDPLKKTAPDSIRLKYAAKQTKLALWRNADRSSWIYCSEKMHRSLIVSSYADYYGTFDIVYPRVIPRALSDRFDEVVARWEDRLVNRCDSLLSHYGGLASSRRMEHASYGWLDIDWWNKRILSGRIYLVRTYGPTLVFPFLCKLETGEMIPLQSLFRISDESMDEQLNRWWNQSVEPYCLVEGERYCNWLRSAERLYIGLQPTGITLSNSFDIFYGKHTSTLRFDQLEGVLKRSNRWSQRLKE